MTPTAFRRVLPLLALLAAAAALSAQTPRAKVTIEGGKTETFVPSESTGPVEEQVRVTWQHGNQFNFGVNVDGNRITYSINGGTNNIMAQIDGQNVYYGGPPGRVEGVENLKARPGARPRHGKSVAWSMGKVSISQVIEVIPSRLKPKSPAGTKRRLDTLLVKYVVENKDDRPHKVGVRTMIDMLVVNNDGALYASPTTHPGQVLNGIELKDKGVPEYLMCLQIPNAQNPGFVGYFTFKLGGKLIGPDRVVLTNLGAGGGNWEIPAMAAGDSAIGLFFSPRDIPARGKVEFAYAHGGYIASNPEAEGRVSLALGGSFEPGKAFTVTAYVEDPVEGQSLTLELPPGMAHFEGRAIQPVPPAADGQPASVVLWKARVLEPGSHTLKVRSSNGVSHSRTVTVTRPEAGSRATDAPGPRFSPSPLVGEG